MRWLICLLLSISACQGPADRVEAGHDDTLVIMSFNIWGAGSNHGKSIEETVAVIRAVNPDIVGLQETRAESVPCGAHDCPPAGPSAAPAIAAALGYEVYEQTADNEALWANAILSKYPISRATPNKLGVSIDVGGREVFAFNVHFTDFPYQPYQLLHIPYDDAPFLETEEQAMRAALAARGAALKLLIDEFAAAKEAQAAFLFGDFNEPSWRDWTPRAANLGRHPLPVRYPATVSIEAAGFVDAYRARFADEIARPGLTWTPLGDPNDPRDHHDRIDYVFARAPSLRVLDAAVVGEASPAADIVVTPWPSDHRAVVATVTF